MSFRSPLHVLYNKDLTQVTAENLKIWRKELMLRFDLEGNTTIHLNGLEYDKNGVIEAFEDLKTNADFHIRLFQNEGLRDFLEKGQVYFFRNIQYWKDLKNGAFWNWIRPKFISTLQETLYTCVSNHNIHFIEKLNTITASKFELSPSDKDEVYSKAYYYLESLIAVARKKHEAPFYGTKPRKVKEEVKEYLNQSNFLILKNLPEEFDTLRNTYGSFAHNVVYDALRKKTLLTNFDKNALEFIKTALQIDIEFRNDKEAKELLKHVESVLKGGGYAGGGCATGVSSIPIFILVIVALLRFIIVAERCGRTTRPTQLNYQPKVSFQDHLPLQIDTVDFIGTWRIKYPQKFAGDNITYDKSLTFFNDSLGAMIYNFPTGKGKRECTVLNFFKWEFQLFGGQGRWNEIELDYTTHSIINGDSTKLALPNRKVLEKIKAKLSLKNERISVQTYPLFAEGRNVRKAVPRGYIYTETPKILRDYYKRNKSSEFEDFLEKTKVNIAREYLVSRFKSNRGYDNKMSINVLEDDYLVTFKYSSLKMDTVGNIKFREGKPIFNISKWYIPGDPCSVSGRLEAIDFYNQGGKIDKEDLELCFHYNEGFFFRELIKNLPEITVKPK